jgi:hypothetical protein
MFYPISRYKMVFLSMAIWVFLMAIPLNQVFAAIVGTEDCISEKDAQDFRTRMLSLLAREEVGSTLLQHGISTSEAEARVNALTNREILRIANRVQNLAPAGRSKIHSSSESSDYSPGEYMFINAAGLIAIWIILFIISYFFNWPLSGLSARRYSPPITEPPPETINPAIVPEPENQEGNK